jgi:WD40 repeat protein
MFRRHRVKWGIVFAAVAAAMIYLWRGDPTKLRRVKVLPTYGTARMFISEDEVLFADGNHFEIRNIETKVLVASLDVPRNTSQEKVTAFYLLPDEGRVVVGNKQGEVLLYSLHPTEQLWRIQAHDSKADVIGLTFSSATSTVFSSSLFPFKNDKFVEADNLIKKWEITTGQPLGAIKGHLSAVGGIVALPNREILSCSGDGTLRIWNSVSGEELWREGEPHPTKKLELGRNAGTVIDAPAAIGYHRIVLSPDGKRMLFNVAVWDIEERKRIGLLRPNPRRVNEAEISSSAFTPDGKWALLGDRRGKLQLWDVATQTQIAEAEVFKNGAAVTGVAVSPSGKYAITSGYGEVPGFEALANKVPFRDKRQVQLWKLPELK